MFPKNRKQVFKLPNTNENTKCFGTGLNVISVDNILKKKTSARGSGGGGSVDSVYAQRANEKDTGHALFANDGCCKHTFHFGEESTRDTTVDSNVTCAYT